VSDTSLETPGDDIRTDEEKAMDAVHPERLRKLEELRAAGKDPFEAERFERTCLIADVRTRNSALEGQRVRVAGRVHSLRFPFLGLTDASGEGQVFVSRDDQPELQKHLQEYLDLGDFLGVEGVVFQTQKGDWAVKADKAELLAKALRQPPFPRTYYKSGEKKVVGGLKDKEIRYRQRYVDLFVNTDARDVLKTRMAITRAIREYLDNEDYLEVETPTLVMDATGAAARPFNTYHNAEKLDMHLRISLELPLKRLIVGGIEKVYELGRVFRNEGIDADHNPEFTLLEFYEAYTNLEGMMDRVEQMFLHICRKVTGGDTLTLADGTVLDFGKPWARLPMLEGIEKNSGGRIQKSELLELGSAKAALARVGGDPEKEHGVGGIIEKLNELLTEPTLIQPTFITEFPYETSPLARKKPGEPHLTRRFECYLAGRETGNAFSEINDPIDQRERFEFQGGQRAAGDDEAHPYDADYIRALEYGMPPTGGFGMGIDRVAMLFTGAESIRDVIFFPLMRPEK
jgi:lysyl-tRNA synthetase, class II